MSSYVDFRRFVKEMIDFLTRKYDFGIMQLSDLML